MNVLKLEALALFDKAAEDVVSAFKGGDSKAFFKCTNDCLKIANNKSAAPKCLRVIDSSTGSPSQGGVQEKQAFRQHFSTLMGGEVGTFASLVQHDRQAPASRFQGVSDDDVVGCVPMLFDLIRCYSSFSKGKACGEGMLVSDILKLFPVHLAKLFFPLIVKTFVRIQPPLQ